jgi:hypothetical protein
LTPRLIQASFEPRSTLENVFMRLMIGIVALAGSLALVTGCSKKQCEPVAESAAVKSLGLVLPGGSLCKDDRGVVDIEYPKALAETLPAVHTEALGKAGWTVESMADRALLATRGGDTLFVMTFKETKESPFPMAIVRYCQTAACGKDISAVARAMQKQEAEMNKKR